MEIRTNFKYFGFFPILLTLKTNPININKLKEHYEKLFNESNLSDIEEIKLGQKIKTFKEKYTNVIFENTIDSTTVQTLIENLANGKAIGLRGVSNEMLKY